jgi:hypothetical protein
MIEGEVRRRAIAVLVPLAEGEPNTFNPWPKPRSLLPVTKKTRAVDA